MSKKINYLTKENQVNKLIRDNKSSSRREYILFTSLWDVVSSNLVKSLEDKEPRVPINVINSFDTPHSFVIWGVEKVPTLVTLESSGKRVMLTSHVTDIYKKLGVDN